MFTTHSLNAPYNWYFSHLRTFSSSPQTWESPVLTYFETQQSGGFQGGIGFYNPPLSRRNVSRYKIRYEYEQFTGGVWVVKSFANIAQLNTDLEFNIKITRGILGRV